jgi:hypothetical protein
MPFDIHIPLRPLEIYHHQLPFLIDHKMLRFDVPIEIPAVVYKLHYFEDIDENGFRGKAYDISFVSLHDHKGAVLAFEVDYAVYAWPF